MTSEEPLTWREVFDLIEDQGRLDAPAEVLLLLTRSDPFNETAEPMPVIDVACGVSAMRLIVDPDAAVKDALMPLYIEENET